MSAFFKEVSEEISAQVSAFFGPNKTEKPSLWPLFQKVSSESFGGSGSRFPAKKEVERLIAEGAEINETNHLGSTPFYWVLVQQADTDEERQLQKELLELLIKKKANIKVIDEGNRSALHVAAQLGKIDLVKFLLGKKADVHAKDDAGSTVLHEAAGSQNTELVKLLLDNGADIHAKDNEGSTVLHEAAGSQNIELVKLLLDNGEDIHAKDNEGSTVLHLAAESGNIDLVAFLLDNGTDIRAKDNEGSTVLHAAAKSGDIDLMKFLLGKGADIHAKDDAGITVLHVAAQSRKINSINLVDFLLDNEANIDARDNEGQRPFQKALRGLELEYENMKKIHTKALKRAQYNDREGVAHCLHEFLVLLDRYIKGEMELVKVLIEKGNNFTVKDNEDQNLLQHVLMVLELVEIKAQETRIELLEAAATHSNSDLRKQKAHTSMEKLDKARKKLLGLLEVLIQKGADLNAKDSNGETPLHKILKFLNSADLENEERRFRALNSELAKEIESRYSVAVQHINCEFPETGSLEISEQERYEKNRQNQLERELNARVEKGCALEKSFGELKSSIRERALELAILYINSGADITLPDSTSSTPRSYIDKMENSDTKKALTRAISERLFVNMWEMEGNNYTSFFQWLPREVAKDVVDMAVGEREKGKLTSRSTP